MEILDYNTQLFKNVFPTYEEFKNWYLQCGLSDGEEDVPNQKTFRLIANEYNDSHVAMSPESFKERFANDLYTYYREFEATTKAINEMMALTDKELSVGLKTVVNFADIPETERSTDTEEVDFISNQTKNIELKGALQVKRDKISAQRAFTVKTFIGRFRHLFIRIVSPAYTFVIGEPDEE